MNSFDSFELTLVVSLGISTLFESPFVLLATSCVGLRIYVRIPSGDLPLIHLDPSIFWDSVGIFFISPPRGELYLTRTQLLVSVLTGLWQITHREWVHFVKTWSLCIASRYSGFRTEVGVNDRQVFGSSFGESLLIGASTTGGLTLYWYDVVYIQGE